MKNIKLRPQGFKQEFAKSQQTVYFSIKTMLMSLMALVFFVMISCADCCALPLEELGEMTTLQEIDGHYKDLAVISATGRTELQEMDLIKFPNKKNEFLIRLFQPEYLTRSQIKDMMINMKPPANSSIQTEAELSFLLELQESRTSAQINEALRLHDVVYFPLAGMKNTNDLFFEVFEIFGTDLDPQHYPHTKQLLHNLMKDMRVMEFVAKNHFLRARPKCKK